MDIENHENSSLNAFKDELFIFLKFIQTLKCCHNLKPFYTKDDNYSNSDYLYSYRSWCEQADFISKDKRKWTKSLGSPSW